MSEGNGPDFDVFSIREREGGGKDIFVKVGVAFQRKKCQGDDDHAGCPAIWPEAGCATGRGCGKALIGLTMAWISQSFFAFHKARSERNQMLELQQISTEPFQGEQG